MEVIETGLIAATPLWSRVRAMKDLDPAAIGDVVFDCARTKIGMASGARDSGRRIGLDLGHTVGHAIEAATGY